MKPDWKDAPEWANWLAMEADGTWYWYSDAPYHDHETSWMPRTYGERREKAGVSSWKDTLEHRCEG